MVYSFNPLTDPRWGEFLTRHGQTSVFQTTAWLKALQRTYGYDPVGYTTSASDEPLENAVVSCRVESWVTGRRLVSLPFSDHCSPLSEAGVGVGEITRYLGTQVEEGSLAYVELRPTPGSLNGMPAYPATARYAHHVLDLTAGLDSLYRRCHVDCVRRKIRRAEREGLVCEEGNSSQLIDQFYDLFVLTRRRHGTFPPPKRWFRNLVEELGDAVRIGIATRKGTPTAAMLTLEHRDTLVYKYGASDLKFNRYGGVQLLMWRAIERAKRNGLNVFDLGRTDKGNIGLMTFKSRWGAKSEELVYYRLESGGKGYVQAGKWKIDSEGGVTRGIVKHLPTGCHRLIGGLLYRHCG